SHTTQHQNWKMDFSSGWLVFALLFAGILALVIPMPTTNGSGSQSNDHKAIKKQLGVQGPTGKIPVEMGPAGKNKLRVQTTPALSDDNTTSGDENQPYYIPSPD
ncbi:MAG: hypothetical protein WCE88_12420, partial [Burkholderiales bacterium]